MLVSENQYILSRIGVPGGAVMIGKDNWGLNLSNLCTTIPDTAHLNSTGWAQILSWSNKVKLIQL